MKRRSFRSKTQLWKKGFAKSTVSRDIFLCGALGGISLGAFWAGLDVFSGGVVPCGFVVISLLALWIMMVEVPREYGLLAGACVGGAVVSLSSCLVSLVFLVTGTILGGIFSILFSENKSTSPPQENLHEKLIEAYALRFLSIFLVIGVLVFYATHEALRAQGRSDILPQELAWAYYIVWGIGTLGIVLTGTVVVDFWQNIRSFIGFSSSPSGSSSASSSRARFKALSMRSESLWESFTVGTGDYIVLGGCSIGVWVFPEDSALFTNIAIAGLFPFLLDGLRFLKKHLRGLSWSPPTQYAVWLGAVVGIVPLLALAICSFIQPWVHYSRWRCEGRRRKYGEH